MKKLLVLIASLLIAGPVFGQPTSGKGLVENTTSAAARCDGAAAGYRIWDTGDARQETCDGTAFRASGFGAIYEPTINGDLTINDGSPSIIFQDNDELGTTDQEGAIDVTCATADDCEMDIVIEADGSDRVAIEIQGTSGNVWSTKIGNPDNGGALGQNYVDINQTGYMNFVGAAGMPVDFEAKGDGSTITVAEASRGCYPIVYTMAGAFDVTLPDVTAANVGMCVTIAATTANSVCIEVGDVGNEIVLDGTGITAGDTLDSGGAAGEMITLLAVAEDVWAAHSNTSWVDGGAACP